jgi:hypothetical protein
MELLSFILIFLLTIFTSVMLYLRDQKLYSQKRSILSMFVSLLLQSMSLVAIYRILNFYSLDNTISYYMPNWAIVLFYCMAYVLGYSLQQIFLVSERSIYSLFSLGAILSLAAGWVLGASLGQALNYIIIFACLSFLWSFKRIDTSEFEKIKFSSPLLNGYVMFQSILLSLVSFYFIAFLPLIDGIEYLVYFSLLYLNLFQTRSLLLTARFQPIEITRLLLIFMIESDYAQYYAQTDSMSWFNLVKLYVFGSITYYLFIHFTYFQKQFTQFMQLNVRSKQ